MFHAKFAQGRNTCAWATRLKFPNAKQKAGQNTDDQCTTQKYEKKNPGKGATYLERGVSVSKFLRSKFSRFCTGHWTCPFFADRAIRHFFMTHPV